MTAAPSRAGNPRTAFVQAVLDEAFNQGHLDALEAAFTPSAAIHDPGLEMRGPTELRRGLANLRTAFPDFHFTIAEAVNEGDLVALRYRGQGTHRATFLGVPATGRRIDYTGMLMVRLEDDRIAELWAQPDQLAVLRQLGAIPS
jgi:steroid delta-isomerase-like uncharacterized protein